jgi:hypothetical protein
MSETKKYGKGVLAASAATLLAGGALNGMSLAEQAHNQLHQTEANVTRDIRAHQPVPILKGGEATIVPKNGDKVRITNPLVTKKAGETSLDHEVVLEAGQGAKNGDLVQGFYDDKNVLDSAAGNITYNLDGQVITAQEALADATPERVVQQDGRLVIDAGQANEGQPVGVGAPIVGK